jgi:hypothetical protein
MGPSKSKLSASLPAGIDSRTPLFTFAEDANPAVVEGDGGDFFTVQLHALLAERSRSKAGVTPIARSPLSGQICIGMLRRECSRRRDSRTWDRPGRASLTNKFTSPGPVCAYRQATGARKSLNSSPDLLDSRYPYMPPPPLAGRPASLPAFNASGIIAP